MLSGNRVLLSNIQSMCAACSLPRRAKHLQLLTLDRLTWPSGKSQCRTSTSSTALRSILELDGAKEIQVQVLNSPDTTHDKGNIRAFSCLKGQTWLPVKGKT
jgi:hypothetical protein